ncbi:hypothetical protein RvY_05832 [Ramazzottius varieornatus]|uniref:Uncharacterized protein n=1 Tax=Ramazzottius varieornatus TaxID=947166 RepID=A0A1D1V204_RAMVA|nr:hypothetical protein RvY_05832 [Ramazzottius varieornatus]
MDPPGIPRFLITINILLFYGAQLGDCRGRRDGTVEVRFGVIVTNPKQAMLLNRESRRIFRDAMSSFSRSRLGFMENVTILEPVIVSLDGIFSPSNILSVLCENLLPKRVNALLFVTFEDESQPDEGNAMQYLFQLVSFLQLPAITWRPQSSERVSSVRLLLLNRKFPENNSSGLHL